MDYDLEVAEFQAIAGGDVDAFARWLARCEIPLKRALRSFAQVVDVEAVVQETAIKVWEDPSRITPDGRSGFLFRWACTVALNAARNSATRHGNRPDHHAPMPSDDVFEGHERRLPDIFLRVRIQSCLELLQDPQQRAFRARLADSGNRSDRELAASIGMTFDAFRQTLTRGRRSLVKCLQSFNIDVMEYLR